MKYNDREKKIRIKIVQIDNNELTKCKSGKEFKVKLVTRSRRIIVDPPRLTVADAMEAIGNLTNVVNDLATEMRAGFKSINTRLDKHDKFNEAVTDYMKRQDKLNEVVMNHMERQDKFNAVITTYMKKQDKFNETVTDYMKKQDEFNNGIINYMKSHP